MSDNKTFYNFIYLLPMPALIVDKKGYIITANNLFKEKFKFDRLANKNKILVQILLNYDISNILKKISKGGLSVSTYDYKSFDLEDNEITLDMHFNYINNKNILITIQEKDNFKTYMAEASKALTNILLTGFQTSIEKNFSEPLTNILGGIELLKMSAKRKESLDIKILNILEDESNRIKNYICKINNFENNSIYEKEKVNIHECILVAIDKVNKKLYDVSALEKNFDPSIPEIFFDKNKLTHCIFNIILNAFEVKKDNKIKIFTKINHSTFIKSDELQKVLKLPINIKILDQGPGVTDKLAEFMQYPFVTSKPNADGLGLSYASQTISKYGGHLKYEKEKDGTAFNIFLPMVKGENY